MKISIFLIIILLSSLWSGELENRLFQAIKEDNLTAIRELVQTGADVSAKDSNGKSVLYRSIEKFTVPEDGNNISSYLIEEQNLSLHSLLNEIEDLNQTIDKNGLTLLYFSIIYNDFDLVKKLIKMKVDINHKVNIHINKVSMLKNVTPLTFSIISNKKDISTQLLKAGADIYQTLISIDTYGEKDVDPFEVALARGETLTAENILARTDDINRKNSKKQTFMEVALEHYPMNENLSYIRSYGVTVAMLLERGADINSVNSDNRTFLHFVSAIGDSDSVEYLLSKGADKTVKDIDGFTPLDVAKLRMKLFKENNVSLHYRNSTVGDFEKTIKLLENKEN